MENKKLLKFLLKDLSELEELVAEKGNNSFDELEMEFLQTRLSGVKRMIKILFDRENSSPNKVAAKLEIIASKKVEEKAEVKEGIIGKPVEGPEIVEEETEPEIKEKVEEVEEIVEEKEVELDEEEVVEKANQRLGDSFSKERSVNDLIDVENIKLEHKLSNRPVASIKTSIGINDRFQYIRELFEGNAEIFSKAISELDAKTDIKEAVEYLQQNFKWKKNETSLKFVNLVKRRFSNE